MSDGRPYRARVRGRKNWRSPEHGERDKDPFEWRPQGIDIGLDGPATETKDAANQRPA